MFNPQQVLHYETFGYVVMRNVFSAAEIETMQREFDQAMERIADFVPTPCESTYAHSNLLGDDTPFFAELTEDELRCCFRSTAQLRTDAVGFDSVSSFSSHISSTSFL